MPWATRGCKSSRPAETALKWDVQKEEQQTGDPFSVGAGSLQPLLTTSPRTPGPGRAPVPTADPPQAPSAPQHRLLPHTLPQSPSGEWLSSPENSIARLKLLEISSQRRAKPQGQNTSLLLAFTLALGWLHSPTEPSKLQEQHHCKPSASPHSPLIFSIFRT